MDKIRRASKRDFFIAQNMIFDLDISEHAKIAYLFLCRCADDESQAFPSYSTIAQKCSFSRRTAINVIQELQEVGLLSVKRRKILKNGKPANTSNLYILYDSPNDEVVHHVHQGSAPRAPGVVHHVHQGSAPRAPRTIPNKEYPNNKNTQSVSLYMPDDEKKTEKEIQPASTIDRQTEFHSVKSHFEEQLSISELSKLNEYPQELITEILLNILEMYFNEYTTIQGEKKPMMLVRSALMKLTYWHIVSILNKYINLETKIINPKAYIQTMIYNAAFENDLSITNYTRSL